MYPGVKKLSFDVDMLNYSRAETGWQEIRDAFSKIITMGGCYFFPKENFFALAGEE